MESNWQEACSCPPNHSQILHSHVSFVTSVNLILFSPALDHLLLKVSQHLFFGRPTTWLVWVGLTWEPYGWGKAFPSSQCHLLAPQKWPLDVRLGDCPGSGTYCHAVYPWPNDYTLWALVSRERDDWMVSTFLIFFRLQQKGIAWSYWAPTLVKTDHVASIKWSETSMTYISYKHFHIKHLERYLT